MFIDEVRSHSFCVKIMDGERTDGASGSLEIGNSGRVFIMALTSLMKVLRTSKVKSLGLFSNSRASKIRRQDPIRRSQAPPT